ncbi:HPr family phosphocarrier protein [uncultured Olsenella sp.]|uniref:HPr family phosphocarrier protein n=1 Tax=uncultured Olsenella sp. TaxID=190764 RepID=UPI0026DA8656|nr:HPr family phosphocarrier protein [uncultured Olsenella sp.]
MVSKQVTIVSATGLHARPASQFVQVAKQYQSAVTIKDVDKGTAPVNAKSIMMILAAGLGTGTKVEISCDGPDEQDALGGLLGIKDGDESLFGE